MAIYHIIGIVHPANGMLNITIPVIVIPQWKIECRIESNTIFWIFESQEKSLKESNARKMIKDILQEEVSFQSFITGTGYEVEIVKMSEEEKEWKIYQASISSIYERNQKKIANLRNEMLKIQTIYRENKDYSHYIRRCFWELNKAIRFPLDTGFHCYRAIESLRNYCGRKYHIFGESYPHQKKNENSQDEIEAWEKLKELTGTNRNHIESWRDEFALRARHAEHKDISDLQRQEIFLTTWDIVEKFIESQYNL